MSITISKNLTPSAISGDDYGIIQAPTYGAEKEVYLSPYKAVMLGLVSFYADATPTFENLSGQIHKTLTGTVASNSTALTGTSTKFTTQVEVGDILKCGTQYVQVTAIGSDTDITVDTAPNPVLVGATVTCYPSWPIVAFILGELKVDGTYNPSADTQSAVVTLANGLAGDFTPVAYSGNQSLSFSAGRAVELSGVVTGPVLNASNALASVTNAKRGSLLGLIQIPKFASYRHVANTTGADIVVPVKSSKSIARGLLSSFYNKPGKTKEGSLKVTSYDMGIDDGIARFRGTKCQAMLQVNMEEQIVRERQFCVNYSPDASETNGAQDNESTQECNGNFQFLITLPAP